ncbi:hypothetical cytosolic protein [Syntrophus aciditrophicus SB]|uniref:Hypothetical cytosolic protein n=1 Tax=Syntrophus aciditrophicus (strain SB) TaxID=56780 RepID=Q2LY07_SYNAS|nr:hypothetical cytosolic protein [Syntrophus aciditrophicus SB]
MFTAAFKNKRDHAKPCPEKGKVANPLHKNRIFSNFLSPEGARLIKVWKYKAHQSMYET